MSTILKALLVLCLLINAVLAALEVETPRLTKRDISWQPANWALGCDFPGNDLSKKQLSSEQCGGACAATSGCSHFTWTSFNGGTCWMKQGNVHKSEAVSTNDQSMVCGVMDGSPGGIDWQPGNWAMGCDFLGNDLSKGKMSGEQCGGACASTSGCTHFTWTSFNEGTCWMKQGDVQRSDAVENSDKSVVCGIVTPFDECAAGPLLNSVLATRHGAVNDLGGACALPEGSYTVTTPVALGNIPALQHLAYRPNMCGHILSVNCGNGFVEIIVANSNLGGGLDLYGSSWEKATGGKPPGEASCSVCLTSKNTFNFDGPRCYYDPSSEKYNEYSHLIGVFNTNGRVVKSATLDGKAGSFNGLTPYFAFYFGPVSPFAAVVFAFEDGSSYKISLKDCVREDNKHGWS